MEQIKKPAACYIYTASQKNTRQTDEKADTCLSL